jgi:hypothetical protein
MVANAAARDQYQYYFLRVTPTVTQLAPVYTLFCANEEELTIAVSDLRNESMQLAIRQAEPGNANLLRYIEHFSLKEANTRKKTTQTAPLATAPLVPTVALPVVPSAAPALLSEAPNATAPLAPSLPAAPVRKIKKKLRII